MPSDFDAALKRRWVPVMKADGFRVAGKNARRVRENWIQVITVQVAREGGAFAVNLGLQPVALPDVLGQCPDPQTIQESGCVFRRRMSESGEDQWWSLGEGLEGADSAVTAMVSDYQRWAAPMLETVGGPECPFGQATVADLEQGGGILAGWDFVPAKFALNLARLRRAAGRMEETRELARFGLAHLGRATLLQPELERLSREGEESS